MLQEDINKRDPFPHPITISGTIDANGRIIQGTGFRVLPHENTGVYEITFTTSLGMIQEGAFSVTAIPSDRIDDDLINEKSDEAVDYRYPRTGANAVVVSGDENGMKYFTFLLEKYDLHMKDYGVKFVARGMVM